MIERLKNIEIVVAVSENDIIGKDNKLIWHIKEDLQLFKKITDGNFIVMGRKTFESLPCILPNRHHIVLTNNKDYKVNHERVTVFYSVTELLTFIYDNSNKKFFIIGGGQIYNLFYPLVSTLNLSRVHQEVEGDTYFPKVDDSWSVNYKEEFNDFTYYRYIKKS